MQQLVENAVIAGRFRLNRLLGRGGMGSVWHATHLGLDIPCAVKFIEGEFASIPEAAVRFEREAKAAAQLRSPHVVQILDHGVCDERPYIAMELLDGEDLGKRLQSMGKLHYSEINTIVGQVCRALTKAHALGIVHRDLKPDNIFLVRDDDREIAKVLDFGIAKSKSSGLETSSNTRTGAMLGTPYYMSPEQAQGIKSVDSRSDLWSLAVIVYQCVTGKLPFESEALGDLLVKIIVSPIPVPSEHAMVPPGFDTWWAKAANRDPNARFQTAKEFAESLGMALGASSLTDVMDAKALRSALARTEAGAAAGSGGGVPAATPQPFGGTPQPHAGGAPPGPFAGTPYPHAGTPQPFGGTPQPFAGQAHAGAPQALGLTPQPFAQTPRPSQPPLHGGTRPLGATPHPAMGAAGGQVNATTGAPITTTFSGMNEGLPSKKRPGPLMIAVFALPLLIIVSTVAMWASRSSSKDSSAAASSSLPATTQTASAAPAPPATETAQAAAPTPEPTVAPSAQPAAAATVKAAAPTPAPVAAKPVAAQPAVAAPKPSASAAPRKQRDTEKMGF